MEHVDLINRIIEAEQEAQRIAGQARDKLGALPEELKGETDKLRKELYKRADRRIDEVRAQEQEWAARRVAQMEARHAADLAALERSFAEHRQEWADRLLDMVTGR
ncbi:MAG: hypothetical protein FWG93_06115 [Oscillospiraceae bacterium]|nr:hypothetical protein [Oscillospiraceae bacterium]